MFKIESYVTPILLNYVAKYVKNIRPQDAQFSLWEGEVTFQNLDLRLDVLEEELNYPFELLSGHIHELSIHVPWTKIKSEPIRITINTIEFILKLKDQRKDGAGSPATSSSPNHSNASQKTKRKRPSKTTEEQNAQQQQQQQQVQQSMMSGLVNKIINNIVVECHNIILKYVEEDIVVSMNIQLLSFGSADERWIPAMVDVHPIKVIKRKVIMVSDLTICLDKRNSAGQIDVCQEPILYRCTLECRFLRKFNIKTKDEMSSTRIGLFTKSMELNVSSMQFPMAMRIFNLILALKAGKIQNNVDTDTGSVGGGVGGAEDEEEESTNDESGSYLTWAWNLLPSFTFEESEPEDDLELNPPGHTMDIGLYVENLSFTLKNSELVVDSIMGATKRIRYSPIIRVSLNGIYFERVASEEMNWSNIRAGLSGICVEPLGSYRSEENAPNNALVDTASFGNSRSFIDKSLFDDQCHVIEKSWSLTNYEDYFSRITDDYLLYRSPVFAYDAVEYKVTGHSDEGKSIVAPTNTSIAVGGSDVCDMRVQYRILSAGVTFRFNQSFMQVKNVINDLIDSYDYPAYYAEKLDAAAQAANASGKNGSPKLHPPLMEDYDSLMLHIPLCTYRFDLKRLSIELHPKVEPDPQQKTQRRLPPNLHYTLPNFLVYFEHLEGSLVSPLKPDKLIHTTCQLPDKPINLLKACYDNYQFNLVEFSVALVNHYNQRYARMLHIPKMQLDYGSLLQPQHWREEDAVPEKKLEVDCEKINLEFSKREIITGERLITCIRSYQPYLVWKVSKQAIAPLSEEDHIRLSNQFGHLRVHMRSYQKHCIWNGSLNSLEAFVIPMQMDKRFVVLNTQAKVHNNESKWLEFQVQQPRVVKIAVEDELEVKTAVALWMEHFDLTVDRNLVNFLKYQEEPDSQIDRDSSVEIELQTQNLLVATSAAQQAQPQFPMSTSSVRQGGARRISRNSTTTRRISHPEETIHLSSERDDRVDKDSSGLSWHSSKEEEHLAWLSSMKKLIVYVQLAKSCVNVAETLEGLGDNAATDYTQITLPKVVFKSAHADYIARSNMRQIIAIPAPGKDVNMKWTIAFTDFGVQNRCGETFEDVLKGVQTTITIALTHRKEKVKFSVEKTTTTTAGTKDDPSASNKKSKTKSAFTADTLVMDLSEKTGYGSEVADGSASAHSGTKTDESVNLDRSGDREIVAIKSNQSGKRSPKLKDLLQSNLHADTTPIHLFISTKKVKVLRDNLAVLMKVVELAKPVAQANIRIAPVISEPLQIVTATEENAQLKEFMEIETNSGESSLLTDDKNAALVVSMFFCQWTIAKIIIDLQSDCSAKEAKLVLELEDILSTVDKREDFTKYTSKVGHLNLNYYEQETDWMINESLRIKMLGEATNMPFLNVVVTSVSLKNFYKKIGVKRKGDIHRNLSEILIKVQPLEMIMDLERLMEFMPTISMLIEPKPKKEPLGNQLASVSKPLAVSDVPMIHLDSKGFTLYLPVKTKTESCSVFIFRIESIKVTPNLENPLQRNPLRGDVFAKAAQMGMLGTPGSLVEDRQYELSLRNIAAASGNWSEILTHMREQAINFYRTNPAFEWNNPNRKTSLQLTEIFHNFTFIAIYAPCIAYNNVLICGQAIEFNCASDFVASLNTYQLVLMNCFIVRLQEIGKLMAKSSPQQSTSDNRLSISMKSLPSSNSAVSLRCSSVSLTQMRSAQSSVPVRRSTLYYDARCSSSVFNLIDEYVEQNAKTDSGFHTSLSRTGVSQYSKERFNSLSSSVSILQDRYEFGQPTPVRNVPYTLSLVAGIFLIKIFRVIPPDEHSKEPIMKPLLLFTISQPSFIITQNIYDSLVQVSLFNLNISMGALHKVNYGAPRTSITKFEENLFDTRPGKSNTTGIPVALLTVKAYRTKMQLLEVDADISKPIIITFTEETLEKLSQNLLYIYELLLENPCFEVRTKKPVVRGSKIMLMRQQLFNADRFHFKCEKVVLRFTSPDDYNCQFSCANITANVKFLSRPEKATIKASLGALYVHTAEKIFVHPIGMKMSTEFTSEPWHRLPLVIATLKVNVIQLDVGTNGIIQLRSALQGLKRISARLDEEWREFLQKRPPEGVDEMSEKQLQHLKCPQITKEEQPGKTKTNGKCGAQRDEFYQDDLRAGAFQFVELMTDTFLPLPYQIQIIKKNYGVICWRYPQPRKMCKIHIYPVPMASPCPVHVKCRMEYFSEANESFLHFCDFWISETVSKAITLPERDICANIWRVVILQSLVAVNGECFDNSEDDEELKQITSMNIDDVLRTERNENEFMLHPKVLVGCMRIDTSFESKCVPKVQFLISCNMFRLKFLNQPDENGELPSLLKKFRLAQLTKIAQAFLVVLMERVNFHISIHTAQDFTISSKLICSIKCIDYGFLNMLYLLEETNLEANVHVNNIERVLSAKIVLDKLRVNFGPTMLHTLLSSKAHWEELLDKNCQYKRALIPKCVIVNRTYSVVAFGQTGSNECINLNPKECHLYSFRSDYHSQELTFFMVNEQTNVTETSQSVPIMFKLEGDSSIQNIRIGNKCLIVKSRKLSSTQIFVLIKGQIELLSMVPHDFRMEFRQEGKQNMDNEMREYLIDRNGRCSFYKAVNKNTNLVMRLKFANNKGRARSGDIPLRTNKNLPWLVKVPTENNEFITFWVRILREDIPDISVDAFQPQCILITIWPLFEINSMLTTDLEIEEQSTQSTYKVLAGGGRQVLDVPATHLTDHKVDFKYSFPIVPKTSSSYTLSLKSIDWQKFFWYDPNIWKTDYTLHELSKANRSKWPLNDDEEIRVKRSSDVTSSKASITIKQMPSREFSCTTTLEVSPWGILINGCGIDVTVKDLSSNELVTINSNALEMLFPINHGFTLSVLNGSCWVPSMPIYINDSKAKANNNGQYYMLTEQAPTDISIVFDGMIAKMLVSMKIENERRALKVRSKFAVTNFTKKSLCVLPFAFDHKENATKSDVSALDGTVRKYDLSPVQSTENCIGISLDVFFDLNSRKVQRSNDTAYVYFVCIKICDGSDISIPIPLGLPFTRRCLSVQNGDDSIALAVNLIEKDGVYYLNIFEDSSPAILVGNQTDVNFIIAQTSASENSMVTNTTPEYEGRHFEWYQMLPAFSKCYYTPPEMYASFPDVDSTMCNLTLALWNSKPTKKNIKWSKPLRTDKTWEKYLHIPSHGDVKVIICDKHRVIRVSIFYIAQPMEFSVKDLRSRFLTTQPELPDNEHGETPVNGPKDNAVSAKAASMKCEHFQNDAKPKTRYKMRLFIKEFLFSFHTDTRTRDNLKSEIFGLVVDDFMMAFDHDENQRKVNLIFSNLQIDNQLYSTGKYDFPVILCSQELYRRTATLPQIYYLDRTYRELSDCSPMAMFSLEFFHDEFKISSIVCSLSPLRVYVEDAYLNDFLDAMVECEPSTCVYSPKRELKRIVLSKGQSLLPRDVAVEAACISEPLQLRSFRIEPVSVLLSVHTSVRLYIALDHSPLSFSSYEGKQILTVPLRLGQSLGMHYLSGAIFGAGWVVGSLEILGSPSGLARSFSSGLRDFVSMPVEGLFRGPWGFIVGITQGSASLLRNVTAGTVNSVTKLAASVARNLDRLTLDPEHIERTEALRRSRPQGFTEGFSQGVTGFGISILGAVGGIARHTLEARSPVEVVTGMGKGIVGAFTKPLSGAAELVALTGQGVLHTVGFNLMPEQRCPSACRKIAVEPSSYRIWKLLPSVLNTDQLLFYQEVTLIVHEQLQRGFIFLTSTVFAIMEAQWDKLCFVLPIDKTEMIADREDKTLFYVHVIREDEDAEENMNYTNQRIMTFLRNSTSAKSLHNSMTMESLHDLLDSPSQPERRNLDLAFYMSENLGEYVMQYLNIMNATT